MDVGAAEAVDRLVGIADDRQVAALAGEQLEPSVLDLVGVLVLVDEDLPERLLVAGADLGEQLQHVDRAHAAGRRSPSRSSGAARARSCGIRRRRSARRTTRPAARTPRRRAAGSWRRRSGCGSAAGVNRLGSTPVLLQAALDQPPRVGLVVDRELARVAEPVGVGSEHPRAGRVEGHHPHRAHAPPDQQLGAVAHLAGRLVGERDREDLARLDRAGRDQVGDPVGQHPRLARAGAGEDQQRPVAVGDGLALGLVQRRPAAFRARSLASTIVWSRYGSERRGRPGRGWIRIGARVAIADAIRTACAFVAGEGEPCAGRRRPGRRLRGRARGRTRRRCDTEPAADADA